MATSEQLSKQLLALGKGMSELGNSLDQLSASFSKAAGRAESVLEGSRQTSAQEVSRQIRSAQSAVLEAMNATKKASSSCRSYTQESM